MNTPPLLVSFENNLEAFLASLPEQVRQNSENEIRSCVGAGLPPLVSRRVLAAMWGISSKFAGRIAVGDSRLYRRFVIVKGKKKRTIESPKVALKVIQRWLFWHLREAITVQSDCFGVSVSRSAFDAASMHCPASWVCSLDVEDFYPSVREDSVTHALRDLGYTESAAKLISRLCCLNGKLPQGAPTSPLLSHLVFSQTDNRLRALAEELGATYTRYVDDITFSATIPFGGDMSEVLERMQAILETSGWSVADHKTRASVFPARLKVYGLLVHGDKPRLTKGYRNKLRAYSHLARAQKIAQNDIARLEGHLSFGSHIDRKRQP